MFPGVIDLRLVRHDPEKVRASQRARGEDESLVDALLLADERRRAAVDTASRLRSEQKAASDAVRAATDKAAAVAHAKELRVEVDAAEVAERQAEVELRAAHLAVPNVVADGVPAGGEEDFRVVVEGTPPADPAYGTSARDHLEIGELLGALDVERGGKVSGARFAFLTGPGAILEFALVQLAMTRAIAAGFQPMIPPALVKPASMEGTGFLGAHAAEVYTLEADELYLVGTSEVPLAAYHSGEILDGSVLPLRYAGFSSCFRREAGSYGKDTRGIIRVHQFDKVEMFAYTALEEAAAEHERLLDLERGFLDALELPYRVIEVAAGDLGSSAARKYDCEAWLPSQERWLELTSTSNCTDFQARRLGTRVRAKGGGSPSPAATLNGTLTAIGRTIVAILENHQQPDGSVVMPAALRPMLAPYGVGEVLSPR
jgi:seryl-tRNA synthetase